MGKLNTDKLQAITSAPSEPALHRAEQERTGNAKQGMARLKATSALAASALLAGSLLLGACGDESDCVPVTPSAAAAGGGSTFSNPPFGTPAASYAAPGTPSSSEFTSGQSTNANRTYCQSRRTGGYYWYSGVYVVGAPGIYGSGSSGSSGSSSS